jgi:CubicO group peptidase (beta-lactamase class C family)
VELMMANHLNHMTKQTIGDNDSEGFGLGGSVRIDLAKGGSLGSVGQFGWGGAASTYYRIDPKERTVALLFMQYLPYDTATLNQFSTLFYQSIVD